MDSRMARGVPIIQDSTSWVLKGQSLPEGEGVLSYMGYIGTCRVWQGYGF